MKTKIVYLVMALALVFGLLAAVATPAGAVSPTTYHVATWGNNSHSGNSTNPFLTIQHAVDEASSGDTIVVHDGTYTEDLTINGLTNLTIRSENGSGSTTITGQDGVAIEVEGGSDNFTLGGPGVGFTVNGSSGESTTFLFQITHGESGVTIEDNVFDTTGDASMGISVGAAGATDLTISNNTFIAEEGDGSIWGPKLVNVTVSDNTFTGPGGPPASGYAIQFAGVTAASPSIISGNTISGYAMGIAIFNGEGTSDLTISGNTITGCKNGIRLGQYSPSTNGDMTTVTVTQNQLSNNTIGIRVNNGANVKASQFDINYNNISGSTTWGLQNEHASEEVDAEYNWWGHPTGPCHENGNHGQGDNVSDNVDYCKWLDAEYATGNPTGPVLNDDSGETYCTIQAAINEAASGDTVIVSPGKYEESLYINDMTLTLESSTDWRDVDLDPNGGNGITIYGSGHVTVQGFEIRGFPQDGIHITNIRHGGSVTILDCFIHNNGGAGIFGGNLNGLLTIDGNIIADNGGGKTGVALMNVGGPAVGATVVISNNVIGNNTGDGIKVENIWPTSTVTIGGPDPEADGNLIADNGGDGIDVEYVDGELNIRGNNTIDGNDGDGIDIYSTRPGSSVVIQGSDITDSVYAEGINITYVNGSVTIGGQVEEDVAGTGEGNTISGNGGDGGIVIEDVDGTVVIDGNRIADNGGNGIDIDEIETDEWDGIPLVGSVTIRNNDVVGNDGDGIDINGVESGCTLTIGPNNIVDNGISGVELGYADDGADVTIFDNTIARNGTGYVGIGLYDSDDVTIDGNTITEHQYGIALWGSSSYNAVINNVITDNMGDEGEYGIGIEIGSSSHHNGIVGNLIADNGDGIRIYGRQNDILYNVITGNVAAALNGQSGVHIEGFGYPARDNVLNYNNIVGNSDPDIGSYGVFNHQRTNPNADRILDARWNWWGDASGPYHGGTNPTGQGDSVSSYVDYSEWAETAYDYTIDASMPWDTTAPQILTTVSMPDMHSWYSILQEYTGEWEPPFWFEEEFGFTTGPVDGMYLVETTDIPGEGAAPRGIRYVTLDLKGAVAQLMGVQDVWDVQLPEWVSPGDQEDWLSRWHWYLKMVNWWEQMHFDEGYGVWDKEVFFEFTFNMLYELYFDNSAGYSKLMEMFQPGEFDIGVTVEDWAGNTAQGTIEVALVDIALPLEQGWNLRSTPIDLGVDGWGAITELGDGLEYAVAIRYDSENQTWEQLINSSILNPLEGVAIKATGRDALGLVFDRNATGLPTDQLNEGLNLIGLAASPPDDPWMSVDDALISVEEIRDGVRGYIIVESPQQYLQYHEQWLWDEWEIADYHWYFGQEAWTYLHPGDQAVEPVPDMTIGGAYWVYMERDDTIAGFSTTPVFLKLRQIETGQDLPDVPRYPATTMVRYEDWADWWSLEYVDEDTWGFQYTVIEYKGAFAIGDVLTYYESVLPGYGWQLSYKEYDEYGHAGMLFWKEAEHAGIPYYTDVCFIQIRLENDIGYISVVHVPVDVPTVLGLSLIGWMLEEEGAMEFKGANVPQDGINYFMQAMSKLQWEVVYYSEEAPYYIEAVFIKPWYHPTEGEVTLVCEVEAYFPIGLPWTVEQPVIVWVDRYVD